LSLFYQKNDLFENYLKRCYFIEVKKKRCIFAAWVIKKRGCDTKKSIVFKKN